MPIIPRQHVAEQFAVSERWLARYETRGLVRVAREGDVEGYEPAEVRRLWTIVSLHRDLGINLAGVEAILKLREHILLVHRQVGLLADRLRDALEEDRGPGDPS